MTFQRAWWTSFDFGPLEEVRGRKKQPCPRLNFFGVRHPDGHMLYSWRKVEESGEGIYKMRVRASNTGFEHIKIIHVLEILLEGVADKSSLKL